MLTLAKLETDDPDFLWAELKKESEIDGCPYEITIKFRMTRDAIDINILTVKSNDYALKILRSIADGGS